MKKKLMVFLPNLNMGGTERVVVNLINSFDQQKFNILLVVFNSSGDLKKEVNNEIKIIDLGIKRARHSFLSIFKVLKREDPDIVFSNMGPLNLVLIFLVRFFSLKINIVCRESNYISEDIQRYSPSTRKVVIYLYKKLYPKSDVIVAQCEAMKTNIIDFCDYFGKKDNIKVIFNPINVGLIDNLKLQSMNSYEKESSLIYLVAVGRVTYQKGFDLLIESFYLASKQNSELRLKIIGNGPDFLDLKKKVENYKLTNKIQMPGYQENPYPDIYESDYFVLSSRWEGFPNVLLESMACDTQMISFDCKSGPSEIIVNESVGYLVENQNVEALAEVLISLKKPMGSIELREYTDRYELSNVSKQYEKIFIDG